MQDGQARSPEHWPKIECLFVLATLAISMLALGIAPLLMPDAYSWVANTTSESAAQGIEDAWLARLGFLLFGWSVLWVTRLAGRRWGLAASLSFIAFGALMTAAAAFAARPTWDPPAPYDQTEDLLHSIAATGIGFAFAAGVFFTAFRRGFDKPPRLFDVMALVATILLPIGLSLFPDHDGLIQRIMFLIAYSWFAREIFQSAGWLPSRSGEAVS
ncbi:MAG: DUF998 domain-containing protein [Thermomicrobiales bacterium]